jgi:hypothetical protein
VKPTNDPVNYYAPDQAKYVIDTLIPAGLDGYIADIESDGPSAPSRDWNSRLLAPLAKQFAETITGAGRAKNKDFLFGLTSGYDFPTSFPHIPWDAFLEYSNAVYPQMYWRGDGGALQAGGTPQSAYDRSMASWKTLALGGTPIIPIIGQISYVSAQAIAEFGSIMRAENIPEVHFYSDVADIQDSTYAAMAAC